MQLRFIYPSNWYNWYKISLSPLYTTLISVLNDIQINILNNDNYNHKCSNYRSKENNHIMDQNVFDIITSTTHVDVVSKKRPINNLFEIIKVAINNTSIIMNDIWRSSYKNDKL
jgi:hypothetical protein